MDIANLWHFHNFGKEALSVVDIADFEQFFLLKAMRSSA